MISIFNLIEEKDEENDLKYLKKTNLFGPVFYRYPKKGKVPLNQSVLKRKS